MTTQEMKKSLACTLLAIGVSALCCIPAAAQEILRFNYDVAGDSKPIVLHADEMTTWIEGAERILIFKGKVLVEHGGVQIQTQEAVAWLDQDEYRKTGIQRLEIYAEGNVVLENGTESQTAGKALIRLSTRGEIKLRSHDGQVTQQAQPGDPLYQRAKQQRSGQSKMSASEPIQQAAFHEIAPGPAEVIADSQIILTQGQTLPPASEGVAPALQPPAPGFPPPVTAPAAPVTASGSPVGLPPGISVLPDVRPSQIIVPPQPFSNPLLNTPGREFSIVPRTSGGFNPQSFDLNGETAIVITGGVILIVRTQDGSGLLDMEADRLVFWTRGNAQELLSNLRTPQGQTRRDLEFYLSGNVQIRSRSGKEERFLQAEEVYYDVGRNVAVAIRADMEIREPGIPDPLHMKAEELLQLNERTFKGMKAEVFSSRLPSDPGLKVYVTEGTLVQTTVPRLTIFGRQFINRGTGQPETHEQRLFDGKDAIIKLEDYPIFYLPFIRGDVNDPLGPLESVSFNYNRIFGFQFTSSFNVYNLLGIDPIPNTRWRFDVDYMSARGPALGSEFDYSGKEFFGLQAIVTGQAKAYGIDDTGKDQLGGFRGPDDHHPEGRGRFFWRQSVQDLPQGFSIQSQFSVLSDKNFLEQYWKNEFDTDHNQETFIYVKQQHNNWAWTFLAEPNIRNWVDETESLPRVDGYLIGQSFFDILTYNAHASAGYGRLRTTDVPPPPDSITTQAVNTVRTDLNQELSLPFTLGPFKLVPFGVLDLTYYSEDLAGTDRGRVYGGGGLRGSIPFTRLYPDVQSELLNLHGINHKIVVSGNYFIAQTDTHYNQLPQLDRLNDDASDQALRDIKPIEPAINPSNGLALLTSPVYDPQLYAIRRLVNDRIDTLDTVEVLQGDLRQRWQTKRGYPGMEHIVDWMTLDLSGSFFPHSQRDNFGDYFAFLQYDWNWNIGDRTALFSSGWLDPETNGPRVFAIGATLNRPDRTSFFLGYREIDPLRSEAVTGAVTYIFSPKYAMTFTATYDFGVNMEMTSVVLTRMGSDLQVSLGFTYNSILSTVGVTFEIVPNIVPPGKRIPGLAGLGAQAAR